MRRIYKLFSKSLYRADTATFANKGSIVPSLKFESYESLYNNLIAKEYKSNLRLIKDINEDAQCYLHDQFKTTGYIDYGYDQLDHGRFMLEMTGFAPDRVAETWYLNKFATPKYLVQIIKEHILPRFLNTEQNLMMQFNDCHIITLVTHNISAIEMKMVESHLYYILTTQVEQSPTAAIKTINRVRPFDVMAIRTDTTKELEKSCEKDFFAVEGISIMQPDLIKVKDLRLLKDLYKNKLFDYLDYPLQMNGALLIYRGDLPQMFNTADQVQGQQYITDIDTSDIHVTQLHDVTIDTDDFIELLGQ